MKKKQLKKLAFAFTLLLASAFSNDLLSQTSDDNWLLVKDSSNVKFYYKTTLCDNAETLLYKITSSNSTTIHLNWTIWGSGTDEILSIGGNEEKIGSCGASNKLNFPMPTGAGLTDTSLPIRFTVFN